MHDVAVVQGRCPVEVAPGPGPNRAGRWITQGLPNETGLQQKTPKNRPLHTEAVQNLFKKLGASA
jgi:hypothetical protein